MIALYTKTGEWEAPHFHKAHWKILFCWGRSWAAEVGILCMFITQGNPWTGNICITWEVVRNNQNLKLNPSYPKSESALEGMVAGGIVNADSDPRSLGWCWKFCMSNKLPIDASAVEPPHME